MSETFQAYRVEKAGEGVARSLQTVSVDSLPPGDVTVAVAYSSLNYKDALSASGHPGVTKTFPHTPGIDAAGTVAASTDPRYKAGDAVIVTGYDLGMNTPGGFGQVIRVPGDWVVPLPAGLSLREAMILGTAGFTAALAVQALEHAGVHPEGGPVAVTGASGGVGSLAVALLSCLGYEVVASTGKAQAHKLLTSLGAASVIPREELAEPTSRPLLSARWQGTVDTVGGSTLTNVVKALKYGGAVAACGLVGGAELALTVYPFILRGVSLLGVDSAACPMPRRLATWQKLAGPWKPAGLARLVTEIGLSDLDGAIEAILNGRTQGRVLVNLQG